MPFPETFVWIFDIWLPVTKYILEVHASNGDLVAILENAYDIPYSQAINEAPTLSFSLPADDTKEANLVRANEIWLRNYVTGVVVRKFRMAKRGDSREGNLITRIDCEGLLSQLADETILDYEGDTQTPTQILTSFLALQLLTPNITLGTIAPTATTTFKSKGESMLRAIYRLRDSIGGYITVDNDRVLDWANSVGEDKGQQIRYQKNLLGITKETDWMTIGNRVYAYGAGKGDAQVKLSDVQANDYMEDAASQATYGIYVRRIVNKRITDATDLLAWANLMLAEMKDPALTYTIRTTDLSESTEAGFDFDSLLIGSTITVIDEDLGLDVSVEVVKMTHLDLLHPELLEVEVATRTRDITDVIDQLLKNQEDEDLADTTEQSAVVFIIDGGGAEIATGERGHIRMPFAGEILSNSLLADQSGSIVIDIWKDTYANFLPTDADSITASAPPTISTATKSEDTTLTGWTKTFAEGDILAFNVDSCTTITRVTVTLVIRRT